MKIWHHSMTDLSKLIRYRENLSVHAEKVLDEGVVVKTHGVPPGLYADTAPVEVLKYAYTEFLCERFVCEAAIAAEENGYDAFTIGCYLDTGLYKARSLVDIPVLGITETSMLASCTLGSKFAFVTITPSMREHLFESAVRCGLEKRVAVSLSIEPQVDEYQMEGSKEDGDRVLSLFLKACDHALEKGAEVIIPGEGVLNEFLFNRGVASHKSVPILDGNAVLWQYAVMSAKLRNKSGISTSRGFAYAKPPRELLDKLKKVATYGDLKESDFS